MQCSLSLGLTFMCRNSLTLDKGRAGKEVRTSRPQPASVCCSGMPGSLTGLCWEYQLQGEDWHEPVCAMGRTYSPRGSSLISLWLSCPYLKVSKFCRSSSLFSNFSWTWSSFVCRWLFVWRDCSRLKASFLLSSLATSRAFCRGSIWKREGSFWFQCHRCKKSVTLYIHSSHLPSSAIETIDGTRTKDSSCLEYVPENLLQTLLRRPSKGNGRTLLHWLPASFEKLSQLNLFLFLKF